jgi:hypothetical protein
MPQVASPDKSWYSPSAGSVENCAAAEMMGWDGMAEGLIWTPIVTRLQWLKCYIMIFGRKQQKGDYFRFGIQYNMEFSAVP